MTRIDCATIEEKLRRVIDPHSEKNLVDSHSVKDIRINGDQIQIDIVLGYFAKNWIPTLIDLIHREVPKAEVQVLSNTVVHSVKKGVEPLKGVKNIVAVASGKGGVGKSTISVNFALALASDGAKVGILDADIYGPSQPKMLGINEKPQSKDGKIMEPIRRYNIQTMSIGFLVDEESPMIWRGPMVTHALEKLLNDTRWDDLDYLIIDMPPGTGDTQLTLAQKVPVSGSVIVTTPQDIALLDARKAYKMFEKVDIPILGIVENMSYYVCQNCEKIDHIFGQGGGLDMAKFYGVNYLGEIPLDRSIRENTDVGTPTVVKNPDSQISNIYRCIARRASAALTLRRQNLGPQFPPIVIQ